MASDIQISVIENTIQATSDRNVLNVKTTTNTVDIHNADGLNGITPHIDKESGNWFVGNKDTGVHAQGAKGEDGLTPYIGTNGNWWVGETDLGVKAQGEQGAQGVQGKQGETGKSAYAYAVDGGYKGTEEEFMQFMNENIGGLDNILNRYDANIASQLESIIG